MPYCQDRKDDRKGFTVGGQTGAQNRKQIPVNLSSYLTSGKQLSRTKSVECVVG